MAARSASRSQDVFVATSSYSTSIGGAPVIITKGKDRARADHELVRQNPELWEPVDLSVKWDPPEDASSEPGTKRGQGQSQEAALSKTRTAPVETRETKK